MTPKDIAIALVPPLSWGAGFTIAKPAVEQFQPLFMMSMIYLALVMVLVPTARSPIRTPWLSLFAIAAFAVPIQGVFIFLGLKYLPASVATLVLQVQVPFAVLLGWLVGGEEINAGKIFGTFVALSGVAAVVGLPQEAPPILPVIFIILGSLFWAFGQVLARRLGRDTGIIQLKGMALAGLPQIVIATLVFERGQWESVASAGSEQWLALAFVTGIGFYVGYAVWFSLLRRHRMDEIAPFVLLMPVVGIVTAAILLGERISPIQVAGGLVILAGLSIVSGIIPLRLRRA
ncbi:MAG: EamA family transporter [Rhizobiales bacterium]|nr:EamA family transporter [Hyphomicrobiales bacterium]